MASMHIDVSHYDGCSAHSPPHISDVCTVDDPVVTPNVEKNGHIPGGVTDHDATVYNVQRSPSPPAFSPIPVCPLPTLASIHNDVTNTSWITDPTSTSSLTYCMLRNSTSSLSTSYATNPVSLMFTVIVLVNLTWQLFVGNQLIKAELVPCLSSIPNVIGSSGDVQIILDILQSQKLCPGNPDAKYVDMVNSRSKKGKMVSRKGQSVITAFVDSSKGIEINEQIYQSTVRTCDCAIIIPVTSTRRCEKCIKFRDTLRSSYANYIKQKDDAAKTDSSSRVNMRYITTPQRKSRVVRRTRQVGLQTRRIQNLEAKLANLIRKKGLTVDSYERHWFYSFTIRTHFA